MSSGSFFKVLLKNFDVLAGPLVTLVYPLYASIQAIETRSTVDDQQWLTYWVLYSLITLFELTFARVIEWLPFWPYAKLLFNCWLVLPYFSGAAYVYQHYVRPLYLNQQTINIWYVPRKKDVFSKPDDFLFAAERFIEENGTDAFHKLLQKADKVPKGPKPIEKAPKPDEKAPKPRKINRRVTFEDVEIDKTSNSHKNDSHTIFGSSGHTIFGSSNNNGVFDCSNIHPIYDDEPERESVTWTNSNFMIFDDEHYSRRHCGG